jgi:hypothetical protein
MYPRVNYEMTEEDLKVMYDACKPTTCIMVGGYAGSTPQENANRAWAKLGKKMGFESETVQPIQGKGSRFFSAVPSETKEQKRKRMEDEAFEKRKAEIIKLTQEIDELKARRDAVRDQR